MIVARIWRGKVEYRVVKKITGYVVEVGGFVVHRTDNAQVAIDTMKFNAGVK